MTTPSTIPDLNDDHDYDRDAPPRLAVEQASAGASSSSDAADRRDDRGVERGVSSPFQPLIERGVAKDVWEARGYMPYFGRHHPDHDPAAFREALKAYDLTAGQRATLARLANRARDSQKRDGYGDGLLVHKHPVPGEPPVASQLRPRYRVLTGGKTSHRHDVVYRDNLQGLQRHLADQHPGEVIAFDTVHLHWDEAKYLLPPRANEDRWHDHADHSAFQGPKGDEKLRQHLASRHGGIDEAGQHSHRMKKRGQHIADRLDIHPWALERLADAERVYLALEGAIKADSILTRIRARGTRESVFDVASVTVWPRAELARFAQRFLRGKHVVIVIDADGHTNLQVMRQAMLCREFLRRRGISAHVAAPPDARDEFGELRHKGVDDFLALGHDLDELVVIDRHAPLIDREVPFVLALYTDRGGRIRSSVWGLSALLGVRRDAERVRDVLQSYIDHGFITADRPLVLELSEWAGTLEWRGAAAGWPTLTLREDVRYSERMVPLAQFQPLPPVTRESVFAEELERSRVKPTILGNLAAAVECTAEREGVKPDTISREPYVLRFRDIHRFIRRLAARVAADSDHPVEDTKRVARWFNVDPQTIRRDRRKPLFGAGMEANMSTSRTHLHRRTPRRA
jgi:hypothetical protein